MYRGEGRRLPKWATKKDHMGILTRARDSIRSLCTFVVPYARVFPWNVDGFFKELATFGQTKIHPRFILENVMKKDTEMTYSNVRNVW